MFLFTAPLDFRELNERIDALEEMVASQEQGNPIRWSDMWTLVDVIHRAFRRVRYPFREEREKAWERFASLRKHANAASAKDRDMRKQTSAPILEQVNSLLQEAVVPDTDLRTSDMKIRGEKLNQARKLLNDNRQHMLMEHKRACFAHIRDLQNIHDEWWAQFREERKKRQEEYDKRLGDIAADLEDTRKKCTEAQSQLDEYRKKAEKIRARLGGQRMSSWTANAASLLSEYEDEMHTLEGQVAEYESLIRRVEQRLPKTSTQTSVSDSPVEEPAS